MALDFDKLDQLFQEAHDAGLRERQAEEAAKISPFDAIVAYAEKKFGDNASFKVGYSMAGYEEPRKTSVHISNTIDNKDISIKDNSSSALEVRDHGPFSIFIDGQRDKSAKPSVEDAVVALGHYHGRYANTCQAASQGGPRT